MMMEGHKDIRQYQQDLAGNKTSCLETVQFYLQQIDVHKNLNAFIEVYADEALARAEQLDEKRKTGEPRKKLHGVVIAIKDVLCYKDHVVTASSKILEGFKSLYTATVCPFDLSSSTRFKIVSLISLSSDGCCNASLK